VARKFTSVAVNERLRYAALAARIQLDLEHRVRGHRAGSATAVRAFGAIFLQMVRNLQIADGNGPSLSGPEEPVFPRWAGILVGNSKSSSTIHR
jgi:hypothetical protein